MPPVLLMCRKESICWYRMRSRFSEALQSFLPAPLVQASYGICSLGCDLSVPPASRDRECCRYIYQLAVPSSALQPCWRTFPLSLYPVYCCTRQGVGMSLAQRVIFVLTQSSPRGSCSVVGELLG